MVNLLEILYKVLIMIRDNPDWRVGQTLFNVTYELYPDVANKLRGTRYDCFHDDNKIEIFIEKLYEMEE